MADIKVERPHAGGMTWAWWAILLIAAFLILGFFTNWYGLTSKQAALYDPARPVASISYKGSTWVPRGDAVAFPSGQMVAVGTSPDGYTLYANKEQGYQQGGGGGGELTPSTEPQAYGRVYLKTVNGRYQPFFLKR